jgi:hypothetical protein
MTTAPPASDQTTPPDPAGADKESRVERLLALVRKLIDYGKELAVTFQRRGTDPNSQPCCFGTTDIALILARITQGLHRARALEEKLAGNAARLDAEPKPTSAPSPRAPRAVRTPVPQARSAAAPNLAHLPTPEQIAAQVRRRPIGAVIADICRDLGIMPSHPLWRELSLVIIRYGGSLAALYKDVNQRAFSSLSAWRSAATPPAQPAASSPLAAAPAGTGPP